MIKQQALKYLGYHNQLLDDDFDKLYDICEQEVIEQSHFKQVHQIYTLTDDLMIQELNISLLFGDTKYYLQGCHHVMLIGATLGIGVERRIKYTSKIDMSKAVIMDAIASSYLEYALDEYEKTLDLKDRTFRFAPGYGDVPVSLNREFYKYLNMYKYLGVTLTESGLFVPQKTMLCFIGIGKDHRHKECGHCIRKDTCILRKDNKRCWID